MARDFPEGIRKSLIVLIESMSNEQIAKADRIEITADIEAD